MPWAEQVFGRDWSRPAPRQERDCRFSPGRSTRASATASGVEHAPATDAARHCFCRLEVTGADDRIGDRVIVRIVDVRRLLSGEANRQQPSR